jgi:hypothetical protein
MVKHMKIISIAKAIHSGTFSYAKHKSEYSDSKFDRDWDIFISYLCQLPYVKIVTLPVGYIMWIASFIIPNMDVIIEVVYDACKKKLKKAKS